MESDDTEVRQFAGLNLKVVWERDAAGQLTRAVVESAAGGRIAIDADAVEQILDELFPVARRGKQIDRGFFQTGVRRSTFVLYEHTFLGYVHRAEDLVSASGSWREADPEETRFVAKLPT